MFITSVLGLITFAYLIPYWGGFIALSLTLISYMCTYSPTMKSSLFANVGYDYLSYILIILSIWVSSMAILNGPKNPTFMLLFNLILLLLITSFFSTNFFLFYIAFEMVLIPMFLVIIWFGSQPERMESALYSILYTVLGSLPLLIGLMMTSHEYYTLTIPLLTIHKSEINLSMSTMMILAFLVKTPMYGVHLWLPKAHAEAPVGGSMILAGVLLKLGGYGLIRMLPLLYSSLLSTALILSISIWGAIICALNCFSLLDIKKLVAYSSIVHMGMMLAGLFTSLHLGLIGTNMMMISHGLSSSGSFFMANSIYLRVKTRNLLLIKGLMNPSPKLSLWLFIMAASAMGTPPFSSFFAELILGAILLKFTFMFLYILMPIYILPVAYMMYMFSIIALGPPQTSYNFPTVNVLELFTFLLHTAPLILLSLNLNLFSP